jgi:serine/threonine protein kinase
MSEESETKILNKQNDGRSRITNNIYSDTSALYEIIRTHHDATVRRNAVIQLICAVDDNTILDVGRIKNLYDMEKDVIVATLLKRLINKLQIGQRLEKDITGKYDKKLSPDEEKIILSEIEKIRILYDKTYGKKGEFDRKYRIIEKIADGGMGKIFRGVRKKDNQLVAIKFLLLEQLSKNNNPEQMIDRFKREGQLLTKRFNHPNIIRGYEYGEDDGEHFVVLEYAGGGNLEDRINKRTIDGLAFEDIALQLCHAIKYIHDVGVIHRDIKPGNILFARDNSNAIKLADFGLAKDKKDARLSKISFQAGTDDYASPQQLLDARNADEQDDIFSIGKTLKEMFESTQFSNGAISREEEESAFCTHHDFDSVFRKCIAPEKKDRFQSVSTLRNALEDIFDRRRG